MREYELNSITGAGMPIVKFQSSERIESLRKGQLYAKSLQFYRELEEKTGDDSSGDKQEGMLYSHESVLFIPGQPIINLKDEQLKTSHSNDFVFCMFGLNHGFQSFTFSDEQKEKMLSFGDTALIILNTDLFIEKVFSAAQKRGYEARFHKVRYYNPYEDTVEKYASMMDGMWNVAFWKRMKYSYQSEVRFSFSGGKEDDHILLDIGDISDISAVVPSEKVLSARIVERIVEG